MLLTAAALALAAFSCSGRPKGEPVMPKDGVFAVDVGGLGKNQVRFYGYAYNGKEIRFLVARAPSGDIKTAFDACETCYPHKMGYRQEQDCVTCVYCNTPFRIETLEQGIGNCVPIRIAHRLAGDTVYLDQKEVEAGARWF